MLKDVGLRVSSADYVSCPRSGYRALHLWFPYEVQVGADKVSFHCEVQIHSLLQDAWAKLSRVDIYRVDAPPQLAEAMERLSKRLYEADRIADRVRTRVARPFRGCKPAAGAPISAEAIAFLYEHTFGEEPPDYLFEAPLKKLPTRRSEQTAWPRFWTTEIFLTGSQVRTEKLIA